MARLLPGSALLVLELASGGSDILTPAEGIDPRVPANLRDHREQHLGTVGGWPQPDLEPQARAFG